MPAGEEKHDGIVMVAIHILIYLRKNPRAEDTAGGIAQWWVHEDTRSVEKALKLLVTNGVVEREGSVYRLKQSQ